MWYPITGKFDDGGSSSVEIVTFGGGTDEQILAMLDAYYQDKLSWEDMAWTIGDERTIHLSAMTAANPNSSTTMPAQDITVVIVDHDHHDLATAINGHTKACITVQTKECLHNLSQGYNESGCIYINGDASYDKSFTKWSNLYMRTYLNDKVWGAFPTDFKAGIKPSKHYRHTTYNGSASEEVTDNLFLPSYPEVFGTASYSYYVATSPVEGTQLAYYASGDSTRRIKYGNNNGSPNSTKAYWWLGSASSFYHSSYGNPWVNVYTDGSASRSYGGGAGGLAPAFVM